MKRITNNITCLNLNFANGFANTFINCPFLVNELQVVGLSLSIPLQYTNTNSQISYSTANFIGSAVDTQSSFNGSISSPDSTLITGSIDGNELNVTIATTGTIGIGAVVSGGVLPLTTITGFGTGRGGLGTYYINNS